MQSSISPTLAPLLFLQNSTWQMDNKLYELQFPQLAKLENDDVFAISVSRTYLRLSRRLAYQARRQKMDLNVSPDPDHP